jgi:hypothetical protein
MRKSELLRKDNVWLLQRISSKHSRLFSWYIGRLSFFILKDWWIQNKQRSAHSRGHRATKWRPRRWSFVTRSPMCGHRDRQWCGTVRSCPTAECHSSIESSGKSHKVLNFGLSMERVPIIAFNGPIFQGCALRRGSIWQFQKTISIVHLLSLAKDGKRVP